jgi:peptide/nickel transport system substrate-binding protein
MMAKRWLGWLAGTTAVVALSLPALAATPRNFLVIGTDVGAIPTLDPAMLNARTVSEVVSNLYDNLVRIPADDMTKLLPMLAERWVVAPDARSITLTLREGARFASGSPITAEDAAWSIQRVIKSGGVGATDIAQWGFKKDNVDRLIRATDPRTLVIELPEPVSTDLVLYSLAGSSLGIIDRKTVLTQEKDGDLGRGWLKANAAPSGPFKLIEWRPNDIVVTERVEGYWGGQPAMRRVIMRHVPESGNLRLQLEAGDIDVGQYVGAGDLEALARNGDVVIENVPGFGFYYIALNMKDPDLQKPLVRRAFQHVLDWEALSKANMRFYGFPWQSIVPKGMAGAGDGKGPYTFDLEQAKRLLAEAGYPNGLKKKLFPAGPVHVPNTESLQATARLAGIELELIPGEHVPAFRDRKFEVYMGNSGGRLPDPFATATHYAFNPDNRDEAKLGGYYMWRTAWDMPELTELTNRSKRETDPEKRAAIFREMDELYRRSDPPLIVFWQRTDPYVIRKEVKGYAGHQAWSTRWDAVTKQ